MTQYIDKSALVAEIESLLDKGRYHEEYDCAYRDGNNSALYTLKGKINTLEVKDANEALRTEYEKGRADVIAEMQKGWSEEDEVGLGDAMWAIKQAKTIAKDENDMGNLWYAENWLKSLKDRYTWKPSEGQLECLGYAIEKAEKDWSPLTNNRIYLTLKSLKEKLLKF